MSITEALQQHFEVEIVQDGPLSWKEGGNALRVYTCQKCSWQHTVTLIHPSRGSVVLIHGDGSEDLRDHLMFGCEK
jgi:hypothetical protein